MVRNDKKLHRDQTLNQGKLRKPDITRAKKLLKWEPRVSLAEGLVKTIDIFGRRFESDTREGFLNALVAVGNLATRLILVS